MIMKQLYIYNRIGKLNFCIKFLLGIYFCFTLTSCESFLEIETPQSQIVGELVFKEKNLAESALASIYIDILDRNMNATYFTTYLALYTDELVYTGSQVASFADFINSNILTTNTTNLTFWSQNYSTIHKSNALIEGMERSTNINTADKNRIQGEALFFRAYLHFYLVNLFGDIPYIKTTDYSLNMKVSRMPVQDVYNLIIEDLIKAKELLPENYKTGERINVNKWVASALLSRVYLYSGQWEKAETESTSLINNPLYKMETNLSKVFLKASTSTILSLKAPFSGNASDCTFNLYDIASIRYKTSWLTSYVAEAFEPGDLRRSQWVGSAIVNQKTMYYSSKYRELSGSSTSKEYSVLLRIEEQYLIRSEARARLSNINGAKQDLNTIRNRVGLNNTQANTQNALLEAILHERRNEFFLELAQRFFDLKRLGFVNSVLGAIKPGWAATDALLPIPESEILLNPNLKQNPGY